MFAQFFFGFTFLAIALIAAVTFGLQIGRTKQFPLIPLLASPLFAFGGAHALSIATGGTGLM